MSSICQNKTVIKLYDCLLLVSTQWRRNIPTVRNIWLPKRDTFWSKLWTLKIRSSSIYRVSNLRLSINILWKTRVRLLITLLFTDFAFLKGWSCIVRLLGMVILYLISYWLRKMGREYMLIVWNSRRNLRKVLYKHYPRIVLTNIFIIMRFCLLKRPCVCCQNIVTLNFSILFLKNCLGNTKLSSWEEVLSICLKIKIVRKWSSNLFFWILFKSTRWDTGNLRRNIRSASLWKMTSISTWSGTRGRYRFLCPRKNSAVFTRYLC